MNLSCLVSFCLSTIIVWFSNLSRLALFCAKIQRPIVGQNKSTTLLSPYYKLERVKVVSRLVFLRLRSWGCKPKREFAVGTETLDFLQDWSQSDFSRRTQSRFPSKSGLLNTRFCQRRLTDITFSVGYLSLRITLKKKDRCMVLTVRICSNFLDPAGWGRSFHIPEYSTG